ncbi:hypothetical protein NCS57_00335900 [Fusarium keratoplasticum]|uniref:Uncharacterized protein n=1 Tax=Fusarium keratoplasticum TaxID=1328300 RepID=A0ACC0RCT8_9HYPO|nr:hypothetical protein NCS57_00335900 [Fusarium keratoplasticum]KAI8680543.1 hypothetical protein NCS57_00335900 [Fusarium keratoplasticum]
MRDVTYLNRLDNNGDDAGCTYDYYGNADGIEPEGEDINAAYAPEFGRTNETTRNEASVLCPYRKCRTEQRVFPTRKQILKHLKSHAACLQICAFCGEICTKVSVALSHDCDERQVTNRNDRASTNNWKEVYRSDRREHLTHPEAFLNRTHFGVSIPQNRKKKSNPMHQGHKFSATKRLRTTVTSGVEANNTSAMDVPHRNNISHSSEAQLVQFHLTQTQWEDGETTIEAP